MTAHISSNKTAICILMLLGLAFGAVVETRAANDRFVEFLPSRASVSSYLGSKLGSKNSTTKVRTIKGELISGNAEDKGLIRSFQIHIDVSNEAGAAFFASCLMHPNVTILLKTEDAVSNEMSVKAIDDWLLAPYPDALELGVDAVLTEMLKTSEDQMADLLKPHVEKVSSDLGIPTERVNTIVKSLLRLVHRQSIYSTKYLNLNSDTAISAEIGALYHPVSLNAGLSELTEINQKLSTSALLQVLNRDYLSPSMGLKEKRFIAIYIKTLIAELKDQVVIDQLIVDYKDSNVEPIQISLLQKISEYSSPAFIDFVLRCFDSDFPNVEYQAIFALHEMGIPNLPDLPLFRVFKENPMKFKAQYEPVVNLLRQDRNKNPAPASDSP